MQKDEVFAQHYRKLNAKQREAVDSIEGPVMVIAGPGTGKTTILVLRIAQILRKTDTPPSGILAITYTDAGVKAMRTKLRDVIGARAEDVKIYTFHSFAASIIAEWGEHFPYLVGARQMTDVESEVFIRDILKDKKFSPLRPLGNPDFYVRSVIQAISEAKREAYTPAMVRSFAEKEMKRLAHDTGSVSMRGKTKGELNAKVKKEIEKCKRTVLFAEVYTRYETKKREEKRIDYDDLIIELLVAFRSDELLLRLIQERFLYIHVDEHQDTNDSQNFLVAILADFFETPNVFIVGDEKQAIYRFQGASVENFLKFEHRWKDMKVISLETNYRSQDAILGASFAMIENNYERDEHKNLRVRLKPAAIYKKRPVEVVMVPNDTSLDVHLIEELRTVAKKEPDATVSIIVRRNRELDRVLYLLEEGRIPVSSERKIDIFSHPAGMLFFNLIEYLADPTKAEALAKTLVAGLWGVSFDQTVLFLRKLRSGGQGEVEKYIPTLFRIRREFLSDAPVGFLIQAATLSGYSNLVVRDPAFVEVWRGITEFAESIAREGDIHSPLELIEALLSYRTSAKMRSVKVSIGIANYPVHAMTAHGSKGLEFDYVFIPYANEESWIGRPRGSYFAFPKMRASGDDIRDMRRLFYVALTRARKHVTILFSSEEAGGRARTALRFISELEPTQVLVKTVGKKELIPEERALKKHRNDTKLFDYAKRVLLEKGLSVTALNHFLSCPNEFLYQSILKLPQAPAASAEKGTVMHEAFSRVWESDERDEGRIKKCIFEAVDTFEKRSLLSAFDKEAVGAELRAYAGVVAKALAPHFAQRGKVFAEEWSESVYRGRGGGGPVHLLLHGKLDVIVDAGRELLVFDYKTRQAMSPAAIKGETKSSDGNYFRQLVFYRLLLEKDKRFKGKSVSPSLVFVIPDEKGRCPTVTIPVTDSDVKKVREEIQSLIESVWSGRIITETCGDRTCQWCALKTVCR